MSQGDEYESVPTVVEQSSPRGERSYDIFPFIKRKNYFYNWSQLLMQRSSLVCAPLLFLESNPKDKDIYMYINPPWMQQQVWQCMIRCNILNPDISTVSIGLPRKCRIYC